MNIFLDPVKFWTDLFKFFIYVWWLMQTTLAVAKTWRAALLGPP